MTGDNAAIPVNTLLGDQVGHVPRVVLTGMDRS